MSKKNYRIDFAANTVTVTKKFLEEAESNITSTAFRDMKALRAMGLTIVVKEEYSRVLKWFKKTFPHFNDMPEFTSDNKIRVTSADYPAEEDSAA